MLTAADDYLIHQTPHTFDTVFTSDRNFYDRYFFNGYRRDGEVYFAVAFGTYPNMGIMDGAFSVVRDGKQRTVRASRRLNADRTNSKVGPITIQVVEPMKQLRVTVDKSEHGIEADLLFEARSLPEEEPHFLRKSGSVTAMDYTRMTQHGQWSGTLSLDGQEFEVGPDQWWGSRDHSWGVRNVGGRDTRGAPASEAPQFYWNWAPLNFEDMCTLFTTSEHSDGTPWHESGVILTPYPEATSTQAAVSHDLVYTPGTRYIASGSTIHLQPADGDAVPVAFEPLYHFLMKGIGYGDPEWGHGMWVGPDEVGGAEYVLAEEDPMRNLHVQTVSLVKSGDREGIGIYEHIAIGAYEPYGFKEAFDPAP
jgi:hypothetical protein